MEDMYAFTACSIPIPFTGQESSHEQPCLTNDHINPCSKLDDNHPSTLCLQFPSPYDVYREDDSFLQHLHDHDFLQQTVPLTPDHNTVSNYSNVAADDNIKDKNTDAIPKGKVKKKRTGHLNGRISSRKRFSKRDRHSKISTANGLRDRRMRLSLDVARNFFRLQDMLGFDKASRTVEWLLEIAKPTIKEVAISGCFPPSKHSINLISGKNINPSSSSDCEVVSAVIDESTFVDGNQPDDKKPSAAKGKKRIRVLRKQRPYPLAKESRKRARERARERTREKRKLLDDKYPKNSKLHHFEPTSHETEQLRSWNTGPEIGEESSTQSQNKSHLLEIVPDQHVEELTSCVCDQQFPGPGEDKAAGDSLVISGNWSPPTMFSYQHDSEFLHEFDDFQIYGKLWETAAP